MPKVKFIIDAKKELELIQKHVDLGISSKLNPLAIKLLKNKPKAIKTLEKIYVSKEFLDFAKRLKNKWKKIEPTYFSSIKSVTEYKWNLSSYNCYITQYITGLADIPSKNSIGIAERIFKERKSTKLSIDKVTYILAHELFHLHYIEIARKKGFPMECLSLEAMETVPILVFFYVKKMKPICGSVTLKKAKGSYPQLEKTLNKAIGLWVKKKNYLDFMNKFLDLIKKDKDKKLK